MGQCCTCLYFENSYWDSHDNSVRNWCIKLNRIVKRDATCNNYFQKPTAENSGYTGDKGSSGCFLTSACVEYLGKSDDCEELTVLRSFRDNYLKKTEDGVALIKEYYAVAPAIVEKINLSQDKESYYSYINEIINECVALINEGKNSIALKKYKQMVLYLKKEFKI